MKICSFNVNSIRARADLLLNWLQHRDNDLDIICLQETKTPDPSFPTNIFENAGFQCEIFGQKAYNGVAILSRIPYTTVRKGFSNDFLDEQKRLISITVSDLHVVNLYVPHGDLRGATKYHYKLHWYDAVLQYFQEHFSPDDKLIVVGDFNVARHDLDVYDPRKVHDRIGTMSEEREAFNKLLDWGLIDIYRKLYPTTPGFTWWDYIGGAIWRNEGMRIDYILCTRPLINAISDIEVDLWPRRRRTPKPSDHTPIIITITR
jgi:exodeoxyribonuclease-3